MAIKKRLRSCRRRAGDIVEVLPNGLSRYDVVQAFGGQELETEGSNRIAEPRGQRRRRPAHQIAFCHRASRVVSLVRRCVVLARKTT